MQLIVFASLFLGLVSGAHPVRLQVDPSISAIRLELDGAAVARLSGSPWTATVDFGEELAPHRLVAVGLDREGREIARAEQVVNVWHPAAEVGISVAERDGALDVRLVPRHRLYKNVKKARLTMDGKAVALGPQLAARVERGDPSNPHVLAAAVTFDDGVAAEREVVVEGGYSETVITEMTAVLDRADSQAPAADRCYLAGGRLVRAERVEEPDAYVAFVRDPDARDAKSMLHDPAAYLGESAGRGLTAVGRTPPMLDRGTTVHVVWPFSHRVDAAGESSAAAYPFTSTSSRSVTAILLGEPHLTSDSRLPREYADAVAVAALASLERPARRAVVLLVEPRKTDESRHSGAVVRRFLDRIGVPLFVWSFTPHDPTVLAEWGEQVEDISSAKLYGAAVRRLNAALQQQRIVWVSADPVAALGAKPVACGAPERHPSH